MKKHILCFYNTNSDKLNFDVLQSVLNEYAVVTTQSLDAAKEFYNNNSYCVVLIDFTKNNGRELLNYIMSKDAQQKIITMSDNFECSELKGCQFCVEHYKRKRIFRPINLKELIDVIKNFENQSCTYMHKFNTILNLLDKIIEKYNHFTYNLEQKKIYPINSTISESALVAEVLEITSLLQDNHIKFQVTEGYCINLFIE